MEKSPQRPATPNKSKSVRVNAMLSSEGKIMENIILKPNEINKIVVTKVS